MSTKPKPTQPTKKSTHPSDKGITDKPKLLAKMRADGWTETTKTHVNNKQSSGFLTKVVHVAPPRLASGRKKGEGKQYPSLLEAARTRGFMKSGESGVLNAFPFDPAGLDAPDKRVKEVKNARLAMVAFLGMVSQYAVTGLSPLEGLEAHMANPQAVNLFTSKVGGEAVAFIAFLSAAPTYLLAQKTIGDGEDEEFRPIPW